MKVYYNCTEKLPELSLLLHRLPVTYNILNLFIAFSALCSISDDAVWIIIPYTFFNYIKVIRQFGEYRKFEDKENILWTT